MTALARMVSELRQECSEDYVGVWQITRMLRDEGHTPVEMPDRVVEVVAALLSDGRVDIGQFEDEAFTAWQGDVGAKVSRLKAELQALGREPDIGEVAWLAER